MGATHVLLMLAAFARGLAVTICRDVIANPSESQKSLDTLDKTLGVAAPQCHSLFKNQHNTCHHDDDEGYRRCGGACAVGALRSGLGVSGKATIVGKAPSFVILHSQFSCDLDVTACMHQLTALHSFNFL